MNHRQHIEESEKTLLESLLKSDVDSLDELLHEDLLFIIPTGQTVTKEMDIANIRLGNLKIEAISSSEQEINIIDDSAVVSVIIDLKGTYLKQPINGKFKYLRIWKLLDSKWKIIGGSGIQI